MSGWCDLCQNTGELDCHCDGDLCICENNGTYPCPDCDGGMDSDDDDCGFDYDNEGPPLP